MTAIQPGATLGVLGGGQLGRMFTAAAKRMGYRVLVLSPEGPDRVGPAGQLADGVVRGELDDPEAVRRIAREVEVLTLEFENVDARALAAAEGLAPVRPGMSLLEIARDRRREKRTFEELGLPVHAFAVIEEARDLEPALAKVGLPAVLKTALSGYDGKGQRRIAAPEDLAGAWQELGRVPAVLEAFVPFASEISVVGARGVDGAVALFEPCLNTHANHILDVSLVPAPVSSQVVADASEIARALLVGLDVVGVFCVELFLMEEGRLFVNEIAPRPHNSGHLTIEGHATSQFEQQVRAVCGLPLGSCERIVPAVAMANLLGDLWEGGAPDWSTTLATPRTYLHLYGKDEARPGRKMGHITSVGGDPEEAERHARHARDKATPGGSITPMPGAAADPDAGSASGHSRIRSTKSPTRRCFSIG